LRRKNSRKNSTRQTSIYSGDRNSSLSAAIDFFFGSYLPVHRGVSPHTVASYRQCFKQFIPFLEDRTGKQCCDLKISCLTYDAVLDFLSYIEKERGVLPSTRNQRAASVISFTKCCSLISPENAPTLQTLDNIPQKRTPNKIVDSLSDDELRQIYSQIDLSTHEGFRDFTIIKFMYNTGCRASEAAGMRLSWLDLQRGNAHIWGKGAKERVVPLMGSTVSFLEIYIRTERKMPEKGYEDVLFTNKNGASLTRSGIYKMIVKYAERACRFNPSLARKNITPHTLRHTTALHLLQSGVSYRTIQTWLGHANMDTTVKYAKMDITQKKRVLEKFSHFDNMILQAFLSSKQFDWNTNPAIRQFLINLQNSEDLS